MKYDVIIIGAGCAGLAAAIYCLRGGKKVLIIEKNSVAGGQLNLTDYVENYPGFENPIDARELVNRMVEQAKRFGAEIINDEVKKIEDGGKIKKVIGEKNVYECLALIIASGAKPKRLNVKGELEFTGRGVSYCAWCDGYFFKDKVVAVVGGGDSAVTEALYMVNIVKKIYLIHRRNKLRAEKILQERLFKQKNVEFVWNSVVEEILGKEKVEKIKVRNILNNQIKEIDVDGIFIAIGLEPITDFISIVEKNERNEIVVNQDMETSLKGIFAAGDCRSNSLKQITTAVSDGTVAALKALEYLDKIE